MPEREQLSQEEISQILEKAKEAGEKEREEKAKKRAAEIEVEEAELSEEELKKEEEQKIKGIEREIKEAAKPRELEPKEFEPEQRLGKKEEKEFRKKIKKGRFGKMSWFAKGAIAAPFVAAAGAIYFAGKALKILFWDHWLKKYFGGMIGAIKGPEKKK